MRTLLVIACLLCSPVGASEVPALACSGTPLPGRYVKKLFQIGTPYAQLVAANGQPQHTVGDDARSVVRYFCYDPSLPLIRWDLPGAPVEHTHEYGFVVEHGTVTGLFYRHTLGAHFENGERP